MNGIRIDNFKNDLFDIVSSVHLESQISLNG